MGFATFSTFLWQLFRGIFTDLIFVTYHRLYRWRIICHVEKFQISVKNLNNLLSFIKIYAVFVLNLRGEKSMWRKSVRRKNDKYEVWVFIVLIKVQKWSWGDDHGEHSWWWKLHGYSSDGDAEDIRGSQRLEPATNWKQFPVYGSSWYHQMIHHKIWNKNVLGWNSGAKEWSKLTPYKFSLHPVEQILEMSEQEFIEILETV